MTQQYLAHSVSGLAGAPALLKCNATNEKAPHISALQVKAKAALTSFDEAGNWCFGIIELHGIEKHRMAKNG